MRKGLLFNIALLFLTAILLNTILTIYVGNQNLQGLAEEIQGRLYYQVAYSELPENPETLPAPMILLGGGAKWAAGNGTSALFVDWYDNWLAHHDTDGASWGPWPDEQLMQNWTYSISYTLNQSGLTVQLAGDIPEDLTGFDVVVIQAYWACEPRHCSLIRNYLASGGGVVLLGGVPEYFRCYCKDFWTYLCPTAPESRGMQEWLGQGWHYVNTGGYANVTVDNPFGTGLLAGDVLVENAGPSNGGVAVYGDVLIVAEWEQGFAYAYSHEFGVVPEPPAPPPEIPQGDLTLPPSMVLFGGGAKWAAGNGTNALYVDWYSNWIAHHATDGTWWGPWPAALDMKNWTESIAYVLNESGLNVQFAVDIPENLTGYDVVIIHAYWAVEPRHAQLIQDFIANGGGVVVMSGVPEYFRSYCKDWWTYLCPTDNESLGMEDWFGTGYYVNTGGSANVTVDNPFNTSLLAGDVLMSGCGGSNAAIVDGDVQVVAAWEQGYAFAFAREYGLGRLYYQAAFESLDPPDTPGPVGDVTGVTQGLSDGRVDVRDVTYLILLFQATPSSPNWNPKADLNGDRIINIREVTTAILHFYEHN